MFKSLGVCVLTTFLVICFLFSMLSAVVFVAGLIKFLIGVLA